MQSRLVAGETLNYTTSLSEYPASAGWVLTLYLNPRAGGTARTVTGTDDGSSHLLQADTATTATWAAGLVSAARAGCPGACGPARPPGSGAVHAYPLPAATAAARARHRWR